MKNLTGKHFGRLVAIELSGQSPIGYYLWKCRCDCGRETVVSHNSLTNRHTLSCGYLQKEMYQKGLFHQTHGQHKTRLYHIQHSMIQRRTNPFLPHFSSCGGRRITVRENWLTFEPFYEQAIANGYPDNLSVDRLNNNGGYSPDNCRWVTVKEQVNNRRGRGCHRNGMN